MDNLFEASFGPKAEEAKPFSKCGQCLRYLKAGLYKSNPADP
jgi:hypothetical protein